MSGSFWRFGNGYSDVSSINTLLEKGFVEKKDSLRKQRTDSLSSESTTDSEEAQANADETIDDENGYTPNIGILGALLDEQDILDELNGSNLKLIEYLRHRNVLDQLIAYITTEESELTEEEPHTKEDQLKEAGDENDNDDKSSTTSSSDSEDMNHLDQPETPQETHSRRAQVAAEILSSDSWSLTDSFMDNHDLLGNLWEILDRESALSMVLSTYFMKINEHLLDMKIDEMLTFLLNQTNIVDRFIKHIDNPPLMDFLLKVISTDKADNPTGIIECLKEQGLIPKLIDFLHPDINPSIQSAAGDFIKAFVTISANSNADNSTIGPNELTRELVSEPMMEKLCQLMLNGGTSLANGVGIIIEIIRKNNSDYDYVQVLFITIESHPPSPRDPIYLGHLINVFSRHIPEFAKMLEDTKLPDLSTPFGTIEPLGFERFKICELIAELLHCSNMGLLNDESSEEIVHQRDVEREKTIALEKKERAEEFDVDADISRDVNTLSLENDGDESESDKNDGNESDKTEEAEGEELEKSITAGAASDDSSDVKGATLESESDSEAEVSEAETTLEVRYDEDEIVLRKDPVIADSLKISLADNRVIIIILNMFFRFPWNNFLHNVVFDIVQQILNGSMDIGYNRYLAIDLFGRGEITRLIIEGQERCESYEQNNGLRLGYMGHLTLIAEEVVKFTALFPPDEFHDVVYAAVSTPDWTFYVTKTLVETREKYNALLGGERQDEEGDLTEEGHASDDASHSEEKRGLALDPNVDHDIIGSGIEDKNDNPGPDDPEGDQFSRYMSQQMTNGLPDKFGSSDEDDDEEDDNFNGHNMYTPGEYFHVDDDDDDYVDPNDDGQSYIKKDHPLYHDMLSPTEDRPPFGDDEDDQSSSDDDDDDEYAEQDENGGTGLTRSKSSGELNWDEEEQNRLINMANFIKSRTRSPSPSSASSSHEAEKN